MNQKHLLIAIGIACFALAWYSTNKKDDDKLPFADVLEWLLPLIGSGAFATKFLFELAK